MALILNIETATKNCSIALAKEGKTIAIREIATQNFSHAEKLHVFIEELFAETNLKLQDLSAIAVSQGPGSIPVYELVFQQQKACVMLCRFH